MKIIEYNLIWKDGKSKQDASFLTQFLPFLDIFSIKEITSVELNCLAYNSMAILFDWHKHFFVSSHRNTRCSLDSFYYRIL